MSLGTIFKAYDVRGIYPDELDEKSAYRIGEAYAAIFQPKKIAIGQDVRTSGAGLKKQLIEALLKAGVDVVDIGVITTDQLYFAVGKYRLDGGISVTASHNPAEYNGFKFSESGGSPISSEHLEAIRDWALSDNKLPTIKTGAQDSKEFLEEYIDRVMQFVQADSIKPLKITVNANFGAVGRSIDRIAKKLGLRLERLNWDEDGSFPKGPPNPLLPENRGETVAAIKSGKFDFGVAWDADADRVFFFTGDGEFIPSCYIISLLAPEFLKKSPGAKIVHDLTTSWVIDDSIRRAGGIPVANRTGHTFIKARMRQEDAPFAGESSGHYYFKDSYYADNGLVPFLMVLEMVSSTGKSLKQLVEPLMSKYVVSGEINFTVTDPSAGLKQIEAKLGGQGKIDKTDGLVVEAKDWRFSARPSNTEPLFRLNAEAHDKRTLDSLVERISDLITT